MVSLFEQLFFFPGVGDIFHQYVSSDIISFHSLNHRFHHNIRRTVTILSLSYKQLKRLGLTKVIFPSVRTIRIHGKENYEENEIIIPCQIFPSLRTMNCYIQWYCSTIICETQLKSLSVDCYKRSVSLAQVNISQLKKLHLNVHQSPNIDEDLLLHPLQNVVLKNQMKCIKATNLQISDISLKYILSNFTELKTLELSLKSWPATIEVSPSIQRLHLEFSSHFMKDIQLLEGQSLRTLNIVSYNNNLVISSTICENLQSLTLLINDISKVWPTLQHQLKNIVCLKLGYAPLWSVPKTFELLQVKKLFKLEQFTCNISAQSLVLQELPSLRKFHSSTCFSVSLNSLPSLVSTKMLRLRGLILKGAPSLRNAILEFTERAYLPVVIDTLPSLVNLKIVDCPPCELGACPKLKHFVASGKECLDARVTKPITLLSDSTIGQQSQTNESLLTWLSHSPKLLKLTFLNTHLFDISLKDGFQALTNISFEKTTVKNLQVTNIPNLQELRFEKKKKTSNVNKLKYFISSDLSQSDIDEHSDSEDCQNGNTQSKNSRNEYKREEEEEEEERKGERRRRDNNMFTKINFNTTGTKQTFGDTSRNFAQSWPVYGVRTITLENLPVLDELCGVSCQKLTLRNLPRLTTVCDIKGLGELETMGMHNLKILDISFHRFKDQTKFQMSSASRLHTLYLRDFITSTVLHLTVPFFTGIILFHLS